MQRQKFISNLYGKQRLKEIEVEVDQEYAFIHNSSLLALIKHSEFEESLLGLFGHKQWVDTVSEMFTICIVNLLFSGKIKAVYFIDKVSIFFNLVVFESSGFIISCQEKVVIDDDDILTNELCLLLQKSRSFEKERFPLIINRFINLYLDKNQLNKPEKKFLQAYLAKYLKKYDWLKITENHNLLGLNTKYAIEIDEDKRASLINLYNEFNSLKFRLRKEDIYFRQLLDYINKVIVRDFQSRYSSD